MTKRDLVQIAYRNLKTSALRNILTVVGIAAGVTALVTMLSLSLGLQSIITKQFHRSGMLDALLISSASESPARDSTSKVAQSMESPALDDALLERLRKLPHAVEAYPDLRTSGEVTWNGVQKTVLVAGLPPSAAESEPLDTLQGKFFSSNEAAEVLLTKDFAQQLNPSKPDENKLMGQMITLRYYQRTAANMSQLEGIRSGERDFLLLSSTEIQAKVVGLINGDPEGMLARPSAAKMFLPLGTIQKMHVLQGTDLRARGTLQGRDTYTAIVLRMSGPAWVEPTEKVMEDQHLTVLSLFTLAKGLRMVFTLLNLFFFLVSSIAFFISSINIINTLMMAVLERRREIGIMKAVGASDRDVRTIFFAEAAAFGALGGLLGNLLAWFVTQTIAMATNVYLKNAGLPPESMALFPVWLGFAAFLFAVTISLLAGIYPARRAVRLDPIEALRDRP